MDVLRTAVSYLGAQDPSEDDPSTEAELEKSLDLWAKLPTIVAAEQRRRNGQPPIAPDPGLSFCENFFHMCSGQVPGRGRGPRLRDFDGPVRRAWLQRLDVHRPGHHLHPCPTFTLPSRVRSARLKARFTAGPTRP